MGERKGKGVRHSSLRILLVPAWPACLGSLTLCHSLSISVSLVAEQELSELVLLTLPILGAARPRAALAALAYRLLPSSRTAAAAAAAAAAPALPTFAELKSASCPVCAASPITVPFLAVPCMHVHCYVCLRAACEADARYACSRCGGRVSALRRAPVAALA